MANVQATTGFQTRYGGEEVTVVEGDIFDASHEIVARTPKEWWAPLNVRFSVAPEEASAKKKRTTVAAKPAPDAALD